MKQYRKKRRLELPEGLLPHRLALIFENCERGIDLRGGDIIVDSLGDSRSLRRGITRGRINMKTDQRGFSLIELLIVVAIILIIAAIAIPDLIKSKMAANQASAVGSLRAINTAEITYNSNFGKGYSSALADLKNPTTGSVPSVTAAGLLDDILAAGIKSGYTFTYTPNAPDTQGYFQGYMINGNPTSPGTTGQVYYFTDQSYVIRSNSTQPATSSDPALGG
jgi:type IV pilus assembly protein PilA